MKKYFVFGLLAMMSLLTYPAKAAPSQKGTRTYRVRLMPRAPITKKTSPAATNASAVTPKAQVK